MTIYPNTTWERAEPADVNMDGNKLAQTKRWLEDAAGDKRYRQLIIRNGQLICEWNQLIADALNC